MEQLVTEFHGLRKGMVVGGAAETRRLDLANAVVTFSKSATIHPLGTAIATPLNEELSVGDDFSYAGDSSPRHIAPSRMSSFTRKDTGWA